MKQVLDIVDARDLAHLALDTFDQLDIFELPPQDHDPAVGVDADLSLGKRAVAKQLALHLAHETDVVHLWCALRLVRDRMREPDDLARLVMGLALNPPGAAAERSPCTVANKVPSARAAARVNEELQRDPRRHTRRGGRGELTR